MHVRQAGASGVSSPFKHRAGCSRAFWYTWLNEFSAKWQSYGPTIGWGTRQEAKAGGREARDAVGLGTGASEGWDERDTAETAETAEARWPPDLEGRRTGRVDFETDSPGVTVAFVWSHVGFQRRHAGLSAAAGAGPGSSSSSEAVYGRE